MTTSNIKCENKIFLFKSKIIIFYLKSIKFCKQIKYKNISNIYYKII